MRFFLPRHSASGRAQNQYSGNCSTNECTGVAGMGRFCVQQRQAAVWDAHKNPRPPGGPLSPRASVGAGVGGGLVYLQLSLTQFSIFLALRSSPFCRRSPTPPAV